MDWSQLNFVSLNTETENELMFLNFISLFPSLCLPRGVGVTVVVLEGDLVDEARALFLTMRHGN